jgi:hypothetical protein
MQEYSFKVMNRAVKANRAFKDTQVYSYTAIKINVEAAIRL